MTYMRKIWGNREPLPKNFPCELDCTFVFQAKKRGDPGKMHAKRPDIDNLVKQVADALQGRKQSLVIYDDGQIASVTARKIYGEKPMTIVRLKWFIGMKNTLQIT
jgi:Holliday junction resolvase RusA-like endonuclease